jgi:hypothetical protein
VTQKKQLKHHHGHHQPQPTSQSCQYGAKAPQAAQRLCLHACAFQLPPHPTPRCATALACITTTAQDANTCRIGAQTIADGKKKRAKSQLHPCRQRWLLVDINALRNEIRCPHKKIIRFRAQQLDESPDDVLAESYASSLGLCVGVLRVGSRRGGTCRSETESLPVGTSDLLGIADQSGGRPTRLVLETKAAATVRMRDLR